MVAQRSLMHAGAARAAPASRVHEVTRNVSAEHTGRPDPNAERVLRYLSARPRAEHGALDRPPVPVNLLLDSNELAIVRRRRRAADDDALAALRVRRRERHLDRDTHG